MSVFDVLVNTDDLVVLGPPDVIDVNVSIGPQGIRGSTFYMGSGDPNSLTVQQNFLDQNIGLLNGDLFINTQAGSKYGWLYRYNDKPTGNDWDQVLKLQPPTYSSNIQAIFTAGTTTISINLSDITSLSSSSVTGDNFVINVTANNSVPTLLTIVSKTIVSESLQIQISGLKYQSSAWSTLTGSIVISTDIAII